MKSITHQEKKILDLIGRGYTTARIGQALAISAHTVESHRKNLLIKLSARNAAELVRKAIELKIIQVTYSDQQHYCEDE